MPGTVKSGLLTDADKLYKCDRQGNEKNIILPLDKGHFITGLEGRNNADEIQ